MFTKFALRSILVLCVMVLLSATVVGSAVTAQEIVHNNSILAFQPEQSIQGGSPVSGGPGFISFSTFEFIPLEIVMPVKYDGAMLYNGGVDTGLGRQIAPANLPHGATISKVVFFYKDVQPSLDMAFYLQTVNMFDGSTLTFATTTSNETIGNSYKKAVINQPAIIDNQLYSYVLAVVIPSNKGKDPGQFNVRVDYCYSSYLPCVQK